MLQLTDFSGMVFESLSQKSHIWVTLHSLSKDLYLLNFLPLRKGKSSTDELLFHIQQQNWLHIQKKKGGHHVPYKVEAALSRGVMIHSKST